MQYKEIRKYQQHGIKSEFIVCIYCQWLSPFFTKFFIKHKIIPNKVTVLMILSGLLGAMLFAVPTLPTQILGALFIQIWFILDCSDGEVARITKRFSTFGKEIDFTAHIINHPCFTLAFLSAMYFSGNYPMLLTGLLFVIFMALESMGRHLCSFYVIHDLRLPPQESAATMSSAKEILLYIINSVTVYPVFALLFPLFFFLDTAFGIDLCFWFLLLFTVSNILIMPRQVYKWVKRIAGE